GHARCVPGAGAGDGARGSRPGDVVQPSFVSLCAGELGGASPALAYAARACPGSLPTLGASEVPESIRHFEAARAFTRAAAGHERGHELRGTGQLRAADELLD